MKSRFLPPAPVLALLAVLVLAALPACAQAPAGKPAIAGNDEKGGVIRNLAAGAAQEDIETMAADYCLHYALDYDVTGIDSKSGTASFDCVVPRD